MKARRFIDNVTAYVRGGPGGDGCISFRREKYVPRGGPDGGNGGHGGNVIFKACKDVDSLISVYYSPHLRAGRGVHGKGKTLHGKKGEDKITLLPLGTEIWNGEQTEILCELLEDGQEFIVAKGGQGGLGNPNWATATHQTPREFTRGEDTTERSLRLELKISADVGLVGFPNAGKSSLLTRISHAHPKVAAYAFTTLNPIIGTIIFEDYTRLRVADIPGLIEGAHKGIGLGHDFLRHIERSRLLMFIIDMAGVDGRDPWDDYAKLLTDLKEHNPDLLERPSLIVANKMDLQAAQDNLDEFRKETGTEPICISAEQEEGIEGLKEALVKMAHQHRLV